MFKILDHLPTFCTAKNTIYFSDAKTKLTRNMRRFTLETFLIDLDNELSSLSQNSSTETNTASVNKMSLIWSTCLIPLLIDMPICVPYRGKKID